MKNLWILTEERPKKDVILMIVNQFATNRSLTVSQSQSIQILPMMSDNRFTFTYQVLGIDCETVNQIFIKVISGASSFVDFLVFYQNEQPQISDEPIYATEETKTTDAESRNTGVYQRYSKFVFIDFYYPSVQKIMLYNQQVKNNKKPTDLDGLSVPQASLPQAYWKYEDKKEKLGTIFIHLAVEDFTNGRAIYENHGGCERGYFYTSDMKPLQIKKYQDRAAYKSGDTSQ